MPTERIAKLVMCNALSGDIEALVKLAARVYGEE